MNRWLELVRAILRKCVNDWAWLDRAPPVRMLKEPTRRIRFLTRDKAQHLLAALPEHLADMAAFSLATGLRAANVTGLQWSQVDLARRFAWVHPDEAKARRAIAVPLNSHAAALVHKQIGKHATHVFSYRGKPITQVSTKSWYGALERAGSRISVGTIYATPGPAGTCKRHPAVRAAGDGRLGIAADGAPLRASRSGSSVTVCRAIGAVACPAARNLGGLHLDLETGKRPVQETGLGAH